MEVYVDIVEDYINVYSDGVLIIKSENKKVLKEMIDRLKAKSLELWEIELLNKINYKLDERDKEIA